MDINILIYFIIYAFIGWVVEVAFHAIKSKTFINRGMLNGPYCPIYGLGVCLILTTLDPYVNNLPLLFLGSVIICSVIELIIGYGLEKIFKQRWWDYSNLRFNIGGYICLRFSLLWGVGAVFLVEIVHPIIENIVNILPNFVQILFASGGLAAIIVDAGFTVSTLLNLNKIAAELARPHTDLKRFSDDIGQKVANRTIKLDADFKSKQAEYVHLKSDAKAQLESMKSGAKSQIQSIKTDFKDKDIERNIKIASKKLSRGIKRRLKSYPGFKMTNPDWEKVMEKIKEFLEDK